MFMNQLVGLHRAAAVNNMWEEDKYIGDGGSVCERGGNKRQRRKRYVTVKSG
jgi:hypothetical protein